MARWLYNSDGDPIAFISGTNVYTRRGDFFGKLYEDKTVWNGDYLGELFADDRLIYEGPKLKATPATPAYPEGPG